MNKTFTFTVVTFLAVVMTLGMFMTTISAFDSTHDTNSLVVLSEDKPYENEGAFVVDVTDLVEDQTRGDLTSVENRELISNRVSQMWASSKQKFPYNGETIYPPSVYLTSGGKLIGGGNSSVQSYSLNAVNQAIPPSGEIDWDYRNSCASAQAPPSVFWDCGNEISNIEFFIEGGGNGVNVGMEECIADVFGTPFFTQTVIFQRNDNLGAGVYAMYYISSEIPANSGNWVAFMDLPTGCGADPDTIPVWEAGPMAGQPWQVTAREGRLDAVTHEMIHAHYDRLNPYYHPWGEGMVEMQAILARKLWCQRNAYTPPNKPTLALGVPTTLPLYENLNQSAVQAAGGLFYNPTNPRYPYIAGTRYKMSATAWWKVWRETSPALIDSANTSTYGPGTYFVDWNSMYWDEYFLAPVTSVIPDAVTKNNITKRTDRWNYYTEEVLKAESGTIDAEVEHKTYADWFGAQNILDINTHTTPKLFVPFGPSTPAGGQIYVTGDDQSGICDFGTYYNGGPTNGIYFSDVNSPFFYQTVAGGSETGLAGDLNLTVVSLHDRNGVDPGDDVTTRISYHDAHDGSSWPTATAWTPVPASGATILNFGASGRIASVEAGAFFPPALNFRDSSLAGNGVPQGGYQAIFEAVDSTGTLEANYNGLFANQEQYAGGQSGILIGGGTQNADDISFNINGSAWSAYAGFGGDTTFEDSVYYDDVNGGVLGYRFLGDRAPYPDYDYANAGPYYYVKQFMTSFNRVNENLSPMIGNYGFAVIAQSTEWQGGHDPSRVYWCKYVSDNSQPSTTGITRLKYRPDYIPPGSRLVKAYIYCNSVGREVSSGVFEHVPILVNGARPGNPTSEYVEGVFLGKDNEPRSNAMGSCACGGWASTQSTFRFDITEYLENCYDSISVTNIYQDYEPGSPQLYGFEMVMIYENNDLPLNQIMIRDGALRLCNNFRDNSLATFDNFTTPPDPEEWVTDTANAGAYVGIIGNSAGNGRMSGGRFRSEWDFWAVDSDKTEWDRFWLNPLPADPDGTGGAWWAPGWIGGNNQQVAPNTPPDIPDNYVYSPRSTRYDFAGACKQFSPAWFWNRNFTCVAAKTALMWTTDDWWTYVNADCDDDSASPNYTNWNSFPHISETTPGSGVYSYLGGSDSVVTLRPYLSCSNTPATPDYAGGLGPCIAVPSNLHTSGPQCQGAPNTANDHPRSDERGHLHAFILQVPIIPSLSLTKTAFPEGQVAPKTEITYTLTITNNTPYTQEGVNLVENYPDGTTFVWADPEPDIGDNTWTTSISDDGNLDPGESFVVRVRVRVGNLPRDTKLINNAEVYAETAPNAATASYINTVLGTPELTISKTSKKFLAIQGDLVTYKIKVKNIGDREATNVVITDRFPRELSFVSSIPSASMGLNKVTWTFDKAFLPGESQEITLILRLRDDIRINPGVSVINTASAVWPIDVDNSEYGRVTDEAVLIVYRRPNEPITCPKPDINVSYDGEKLCINVDKFGGCSPYTLRITSPDNDVDIIATIDRPGEEKCIDLSIDTEDTIQIELQNKYAGSYFYCFKITPDSIDTSEIPCP